MLKFLLMTCLLGDLRADFQHEPGKQESEKRHQSIATLRMPSRLIAHHPHSFAKVQRLRQQARYAMRRTQASMLTRLLGIAKPENGTPRRRLVKVLSDDLRAGYTPIAYDWHREASG